MEIALKNKLFIVITAIFVICILFMIYNCRLSTLPESIESASKSSQFKPTFFEIYSANETVCDRLIIVQPFGWYILAKSGAVFVLNQSGYSCNLGTTPAVRIPTKGNSATEELELMNVCLNFELSKLVNAYKLHKKYTVYYTIEKLQSEENKFTVLDALNYLFTKYITQTATENNETVDLHHLIKNIDSSHNPKESLLKNNSVIVKSHF